MKKNNWSVRIITWGITAFRHYSRFIVSIMVLFSFCLIGCSTGVSSRTGSTSPSGLIQSDDSGSTLSPVTKQSFYFDTICQITVYAMTGTGTETDFRTKADTAINNAFSLCSNYEKILSKTVEGSDIWNINHASGREVKVDSRTIDVVKRGIYYGDLSDGRFDITIGKAEDLWDFHSDNPSVPDETELAGAIRHVDYRNIIIDESSSSIRLSDPETEIDLGGIAKGYIADRVCEQLQKDEVTSAIVSLGGNIECVGGKPEKVGFHPSDDNSDSEGNVGDFNIGIETPYSHETRIVGSSHLRNGTMVTSGVYERYFEVDGKQYHHILDVKTGYPVSTDVLGVTVKSSEGHSEDCDALATICLIYGCEKGKDLIGQLEDYEAAFVLTDDSVSLTAGMEFEPAE